MLLFKTMLYDSTRMDDFLEAVRTYLAETLHAPIAFVAWEGSERLPLFISNRYRFYRSVLARQDCLFILDWGETKQGVASIARHVALVEKAFEGIVVYTVGAMNATMRSRMVGQGVAFTVPGNQLYIPQLAMDLREHFRTPRKLRGAHLPPAAQLVLFHHILVAGNTPSTPTSLASVLGLTPMSVGRAFDSLAQANLARVERRGREKVLSFEADRRTLIDASRTLLRPPARGLHGVTFNGRQPGLLRAGETALAELSALTPPEKPTYAIRATGWDKFFEKHAIQSVNDIDAADAFIETWHYDPGILAKNGLVDPLSLHAQFWDHPDERVAQAASNILDQIEW